MSDKSARTRLTKARKYLELARLSRELDYSAVPYVVAAEHLIDTALGKGPQPIEGESHQLPISSGFTGR